MIGMLRGKVAHRFDPYVILDVAGVGYKVLVDTATLSSLAPSTESTLYTYTHVREDALELYGFRDYADLRLFEYLINVSGVGCKTAMGVFSIGKRSEIVEAIARGDVGFFTGVPRLGKKNAQKIIIELKNKLGGVGTADFDLSEPTGEDADVVTALQGFGFSSREAQEAIRKIGGEGKNTGEKIRLALKYLGK